MPALNSWSPGPVAGPAGDQDDLASSAARRPAAARPASDQARQSHGVDHGEYRSTLTHGWLSSRSWTERREPVGGLARRGHVRRASGSDGASGGSGQARARDPIGIRSARSGRAWRRRARAAGRMSRFLGKVSSFEFERLLPGDGLAGVGRHPAHDRRQGALGDLLQLVERLAVADALEQVDVLLDVGVDPRSRTRTARRCPRPVEPVAAAVARAPWCRRRLGDVALAARRSGGHMLRTWTPLGNS